MVVAGVLSSYSFLHAGSGKYTDTSQNSVDEASKTGPYFDKASSKNVTALLGKITYLNCRVKNLGNKTVSATGIYSGI